MRSLDGVRVLDLTEGAQGPFAASLLADLGAEVVKIERPSGELMRNIGPFRNGLALPMLSIARGRYASLALDLKQEAGRATVMRLVACADLIIQNWKPGTDARLGLAFEQVREHNPRIVYVQASGYGTAGPLGEMGAMDSLAQAVSGLSALSGDPAGPGERTRTPVLDFVSAFVAAEAALIGLTARRKHGQAVHIETSQLSAALDASAPEIATAALQRVAPAGREGRYLPFAEWLLCADGLYVSMECRHRADLSRLFELFDVAAYSGDVAPLRKKMAALQSGEVLRRARAEGFDAQIVERRFSADLFSGYPGTVSTQHHDVAGAFPQPESPFLMSVTAPQAGAPLGPIGKDNALIECLIERWSGATGPAQF